MPLHIKQIHLVQVLDVDEVLLGFQDSNNAIFAYLQISKDGS